MKKINVNIKNDCIWIQHLECLLTTKWSVVSEPHLSETKYVYGTPHLVCYYT